MADGGGGGGFRWQMLNHFYRVSVLVFLGRVSINKFSKNVPAAC